MLFKNLFIMVAILSSFIAHSQVGIGTTDPDDSAMLDVLSTTSGVLLPRLTTVQRNAISSPATGLLVFNTDANSYQYNFGTPTVPNWRSFETEAYQAGYFITGANSSTGWNYYDVNFATAFAVTPTVIISYREGTGVNNSGSYSITQFKVANTSTTGFTIGIYETSATGDISIDWIASPKTQ
jgi:hypothetical protein